MAITFRCLEPARRSTTADICLLLTREQHLPSIVRQSSLVSRRIAAEPPQLAGDATDVAEGDGNAQQGGHRRCEVDLHGMEL